MWDRFLGFIFCGWKDRLEGYGPGEDDREDIALRMGAAGLTATRGIIPQDSDLFPSALPVLLVECSARGS
jgi:hypothetical protein